MPKCRWCPHTDVEKVSPDHCPCICHRSAVALKGLNLMKEKKPWQQNQLIR